MASALATLAPVTVTTAGTRVPLSATQKLVRSVRVEADASNTGDIFIGDANVSSTRYTSKLSARDSYVLSGSVIDLARIYVDAATSGDKVQVTYVA